jgi:hypothetical protein
MVTVKVLRTLNGGEFNPGDTRELSEADAERLAATGAVAIVKKAEGTSAKNKAEGAAASNKATRSRAATKKG